MEKIFYENEYVLWLEFDENMNAFLNNKCELLEQQNIPAGIRPPHLTMTFMRCDNEEELAKTIINFFKKVNEIPLILNSIGIFSGGIVFYEPKATIELLELYKELCQTLSKVANLSWDLYTPDRWTPHIALTGALTGKDLNTAIAIMLDRFIGYKADRVIIKLKKCFTGKEIVNYEIGR